jgi:hypothetical protein
MEDEKDQEDDVKGFFMLVNVKVKLSLCLIKHHVMKVYGGMDVIAPRIRNVGTTWT